MEKKEECAAHGRWLRNRDSTPCSSQLRRRESGPSCSWARWSGQVRARRRCGCCRERSKYRSRCRPKRRLEARRTRRGLRRRSRAQGAP
eukprot:5949497-Prymnesium_polylepis.1